VNRIAHLPPTLDRAVKPEGLHILDRPIESHPGHHLGVGELAARPAYFPDTFIRLLPVRLQELEQRHLYFPCCRLRVQASGSRQVQRIHDFAVHIELELFRRGVAQRAPEPRRHSRAASPPRIHRDVAHP
jgi:hypothetical protein